MKQLPPEKRLIDITASWLDEEDERLLIPRPEIEEFAQKVRPQPSSNRETWRRVGFYLIGGGVSLAFLLILANKLNPPDSALAGQALTRGMAAWEGSWEGQLTKYDLTGRRLQVYEATRQFSSTDIDIQTLVSIRRDTMVGVQVEQWVIRPDPAGGFEVTANAGEQFRGRMEEGSLIWNHNGETITTTMRSWIVGGNSMQVEDLVFNAAAPTESYILSGTLKRRIEGRDTEATPRPQ